MDDMSENAKSEQYQEKTGRESNPIGVNHFMNYSISYFSIKTNLNTKWMDAAFAIYQQTLQQKTKATSIQLKIPYD